MITLKHAAEKVVTGLSLAAMTLAASTAFGQTATQRCRPAQVIPLTSPEPAAKIVVDPPLAQPLASRGVVVIAILCGEHAHCTGVRPGCAFRLAARGPRSCDR